MARVFAAALIISVTELIVACSGTETLSNSGGSGGATGTGCTSSGGGGVAHTGGKSADAVVGTWSSDHSSASSSTIGGATGASPTGGAPTGGRTTTGGSATGGTVPATGEANTATGGAAEATGGASAGGASTAGAGGGDNCTGSTLLDVMDYGAKGPFATLVVNDAGPSNGYTIFRPTALGQDGFKHPLITWGNGINRL